MDNNLIGSRGEDIAKYKLGSSQYIEPQIKGEKYPIWDGEVLVYSSDNHKKENLVGRVPVQIKTAKPGLPGVKMQRKAKVADLRNYMEEGGAIYLGVWLTPEYDGVMYYKTLMPMDIKKLLKRAGNHKTVAIELGRLPEDPTAMANVFFRFIKARKRSLPSIAMEATSLEELREMGFTVDGEPLMWIDSLGDSESFNPFSLRGTDLYSYVKVQELGGLLVPINHDEFITGIHVSERREVKISIGETVFYSGMDVDVSEEEISCHFGGFTIKLGADRANFTYHSPKMLSERILGDDAMSAIASAGYITIGGALLRLQEGDLERCRSWCERRSATLHYLKDCAKALKAMGCIQDVNLEELTDEDATKLWNLVNVTVCGQSYETVSEYDSLVMTLHIANLNIKLLLRRSKGNSYTAENYFTQGWGFAKNEGDAYKPISVYSTLAPEEFGSLSNLDVCSIASDVMRFDDADQLDQCNQTLLNMLSAYDVNPNEMLLSSAAKVAEWLNDQMPENTVYYLNKLQTLLRQNRVNDEDRQGLRERIATGSMSDEEIAGAYILLSDFEMAKTYLAKLPYDAQSKFKSYPIYNLCE